MKLTDITTEKLWRIAEPVCAGAGYELVELALASSPEGLVLRVFIDFLPPVGTDDMPPDPNALPKTTPEAEADDVSHISFEDCERVSRELSAVLDVEDPLPQGYNLEVSSPGIDRPLRTLAHFQRFLGQDARVSMCQGIGGRRNFKGTLVALWAAPSDSSETGEILTMNVDGTEYRLPFRDIESARLVPDWAALFQRSRER